MVERVTITEPFEQVVLDLVGPCALFTSKLMQGLCDILGIERI